MTLIGMHWWSRKAVPIAVLLDTLESTTTALSAEEERCRRESRRSRNEVKKSGQSTMRWSS